MPPTAHRDIYVLITGYGPFFSTTHNPSYYAAKPLNRTQISLPGGRITIHLTVIEVQAPIARPAPGPARPPASVTDAPSPPAGGYDFIFHLGQGRAGAFYVETLGHQTGYNQQDVNGELAPVMDIKEAGKVLRGAGKRYQDCESVLRTGIEVGKLVKHLKLTDDKVLQSHDAGRYLCDFIFYCSLAEAQLAKEEQRAQSARKVLFMHVPPAGLPHTLDEMTQMIRHVVSWVVIDHIDN
ncbi:peptidase C15, pyroglutamyl peptidase I-like protein [Auriculariales sp. MPI-PUGE-AT-0066]|nr:peptidase C15, pyroglutamyl peptidase I-like protein [Auriculariales sp. MPI-PUGE-AT-0066]